MNHKLDSPWISECYGRLSRCDEAVTTVPATFLLCLYIIDEISQGIFQVQIHTIMPLNSSKLLCSQS